MGILNTMFNKKANIACNNKTFTYENIRAMHLTMTRLYEAAAQLRGKFGLSEVADLLGESPQAVKNWEGRGMSAGAMIKAEEAIGCRAAWLMFGTPPMTWIAHAAIAGMSKAESGEREPPAEAKPLIKAFADAGPAKREALLRLAALPEPEMATLLLVLQSIGEKYKR